MSVYGRYSKRLIYGSLLCLSSDDFRTIHIASVAQRDPEHLQVCLFLVDRHVVCHLSVTHVLWLNGTSYRKTA